MIITLSLFAGELWESAEKMMLKELILCIVGKNQNRICRDKFILKCIKELPCGIKILDAGAGQLKWKEACRELTYISQDFCQYDGVGNGKGIVRWEGGWNSDEENKRKIDIVCDIIDIPVKDKEFDAILCSEVLEHLQNPELAIREFARVIKSGGTLILTAPFCSLTHFAPFHYCTGFNILVSKKFALLKKPVNPSRFRTHPAVPELSALCIILAVSLKGGKMFPQIVHDSGF